MAGAIFIMSAGGKAHGATTLAAQTPPSAATAMMAMRNGARRMAHIPSPGAAGSGESAPANSALRTPTAIAASTLGSKSGSIAMRLNKPATKVKKNRAPKRESSRGEAEPPALAASMSRSSPAMHVGVDRSRDLSHPRIAAGLGPDLDDHPRLRGRAGEHMLAHRPAKRFRDVAIVGHQLGEGPGALRLIAFAQALDDRLLGREVPIEVAGAHADFVGDMLHRRRVESMADEGALRRRQDPLAPLGVSGPPPCGVEISDMSTFHENECSFSRKRRECGRLVARSLDRALRRQAGEFATGSSPPR